MRRADPDYSTERKKRQVLDEGSNLHFVPYLRRRSIYVDGDDTACHKDSMFHPRSRDVLKLSSGLSHVSAVRSRSVYNPDLSNMASADEKSAPFRLMDLQPEPRHFIWKCYIDTLELKSHKFSYLSVLQQNAIRQMPPSHPLYWLKEPHVLQSCQTIRHEVLISF